MTAESSLSLSPQRRFCRRLRWPRARRWCSGRRSRRRASPSGAAATRAVECRSPPFTQMRGLHRALPQQRLHRARRRRPPSAAAPRSAPPAPSPPALRRAAPPGRDERAAARAERCGGRGAGDVVARAPRGAIAASPRASVPIRARDRARTPRSPRRGEASTMRATPRGDPTSVRSAASPARRRRAGGGAATASLPGGNRRRAGSGLRRPRRGRRRRRSCAPPAFAQDRRAGRTARRVPTRRAACPGWTRRRGASPPPPCPAPRGARPVSSDIPAPRGRSAGGAALALRRRRPSPAAERPPKPAGALPLVAGRRWRGGAHHGIALGARACRRLRRRRRGRGGCRRRDVLRRSRRARPGRRWPPGVALAGGRRGRSARRGVRGRRARRRRCAARAAARSEVSPRRAGWARVHRPSRAPSQRGTPSRARHLDDALRAATWSWRSRREREGTARSSARTGTRPRRRARSVVRAAAASSAAAGRGARRASRRRRAPSRVRVIVEEAARGVESRAGELAADPRRSNALRAPSPPRVRAAPPHAARGVSRREEPIDRRPRRARFGGASRSRRVLRGFSRGRRRTRGAVGAPRRSRGVDRELPAAPRRRRRAHGRGSAPKARAPGRRRRSALVGSRPTADSRRASTAELELRRSRRRVARPRDVACARSATGRQLDAAPSPRVRIVVGARLRPSTTAGAAARSPALHSQAAVAWPLRLASARRRRGNRRSPPAPQSRAERRIAAPPAPAPARARRSRLFDARPAAAATPLFGCAARADRRRSCRRLHGGGAVAGSATAPQRHTRHSTRGLSLSKARRHGTQARTHAASARARSRHDRRGPDAARRRPPSARRARRVGRDWTAQSGRAPARRRAALPARRRRGAGCATDATTGCARAATAKRPERGARPSAPRQRATARTIPLVRISMGDAGAADGHRDAIARPAPAPAAPSAGGWRRSTSSRRVDQPPPSTSEAASRRRELRTADRRRVDRTRRSRRGDTDAEPGHPAHCERARDRRLVIEEPQSQDRLCSGRPPRTAKHARRGDSSRSPSAIRGRFYRAR